MIFFLCLQAETGGDGVISLTKSGDVAVKIHAKPGAKKNGITGRAEFFFNMTHRLLSLFNFFFKYYNQFGNLFLRY